MKRQRIERLSVLVACLSAPLRAQLRAMLNQEPLVCLAGEAETGGEALDLFFRFRPEIVLVDVCLPDLTGFEVVQCLRQASPNCVLILLSGSSDPCVEDVGRLVGATAVCQKTGDLAEIRSALRRVLKRRFRGAVAQNDCLPGFLPSTPASSA